MKIQKVAPIITQAIIYICTYILFKIFANIRYEGVDSVKGLKGRIIFASNHVSEWDGILIRIGMPFFWHNSPMYYVAMSKKYYPIERFGWRHYLYGGFLFRMLGAYPVYFGLRDYEKSLSNHIRILELDRPVCIFPTGRIEKEGEEPRRARGGVTFIAHKTKTPIVPVHIEGLKGFSLLKLLTFRIRVVIKYSEPIYPNELFPEEPKSIEEYSERAQDLIKPSLR